MDSHAERILVVDDEEVLWPIYRRIVARLGGELHVAADGRSVRELTARYSYACALLDKNLPDASGLELISTIKGHDPSTEILLVTGYPGMDSVLAALRLGAADYVTKPFDAHDLTARIQSALYRRRESQMWMERWVAGDGAQCRVSELETKLERTAALLIQADRLASLGTMAGCVGHELNNVTAILLGSFDAVREAAEQQIQPEAEDLEALGRAIEHVRSHAANLLRLGRPGADHEDVFDVREVVADIASVLRRMGRTKYVKVELSLPPAPVPVTMNRMRIEQILINLLVNAADALDGVSDRQPTILVRLFQDMPGGRAVCRVEDNGPGIPAELLAKVLEPYFTTKQPGKGTGLGLPLVKQIVESYGGSLQLTGIEGSGTAVQFDLPVVATRQRAVA